MRQEGEQVVATNCCDWLLVGLYSLGLLVINLCPVIAQLKALYTLCHPEKYLQHPDQSQRYKTHLWLFCNGYGVLYLAIYGLYYIGKGWIQLYDWGHDLKYTKENRTWCEKFSGGWLLLLTTLGLFAIYFFFELWGRSITFGEQLYINQDSTCDQVSGFIILSIVSLGIFLVYQFFKGWIRLFNYGCELVTDNPETTQCQKCMGYLYLILTTLGLYLIYQFFKQWGKLHCYGIDCAYSDNPLTSRWLIFLGHLCLVVTTLGLYLPFKLIHLWSTGFKRGYYLTYEMPNRTTNDIIRGQIYLTLSTLGLYGIYWISSQVWSFIDTIYQLWWTGIKNSYHLAYTKPERTDSEIRQGKWQLVGGTLGLFLIWWGLELWVELFQYGYKLAYTPDNYTWYKGLCGDLLLTITTLGLYVIYKFFELWIRLAIKGVELSYHQPNQTKCDIFCGYIYLTIATGGIFVPYKIIELLFRGWKKSLEITHNWVYEVNPIYKQIIGRLLLSVLTLGLFVIFMIGEYFYQMYHNLYQPPYTTQYKIGICQASIVTGGIVGIYWMLKHLNFWVRLHAKIVIIAINLVGYYLIYTYVLINYPLILIAFSLVNYPVYLVTQYFTYTESVRYLANQLWLGCVYGYWVVNHGIDHISQVFRQIYVSSSNRRSRVWSQFRTWQSQWSSDFSNQTWPRVFGYPERIVGDLAYVVPVVYQPVILELPPVRNWETKQNDRLFSLEALNRQKIKQTIKLLTSTISQVKVNYLQSQLIQPSKSDLFWSQRFQNMTEIRVYKDLTATQLKREIYLSTFQTHNYLQNVEGSLIDYQTNQGWFERYIYELESTKDELERQCYFRIDEYYRRAIYEVIV